MTQHLIDLLRADGSIIVNKRLNSSIGLDAAVMYSELVSKQKYFTEKGQLTEDGFFFNTVENMEEDTSLSAFQQSKAIKKLVSLNLIQHHNRGMPRKRYFKVNNDENILKAILGEKRLVYSNKKSEEQVVKKVNDNNTNLNNTKSNNKTIHHISDENDAFKYYSQKYLEKFGKDHPTMNEEKMDQIIWNYDDLTDQFNLDPEQWIELVDHHFDNLPRSNNGNILSFFTSIYRYIKDMNYFKDR